MQVGECQGEKNSLHLSILTHSTLFAKWGRQNTSFCELFARGVSHESSESLQHTPFHAARPNSLHQSFS